MPRLKIVVSEDDRPVFKKMADSFDELEDVFKKLKIKYR